MQQTKIKKIILICTLLTIILEINKSFQTKTI